MDIHQPNDLQAPGYVPFESGYADLGDGKKVVAALTRMPGCRADGGLVVFVAGGTDQYKLWHPTDHIFSDWENRIDGKYIGGAHLVHEYLAGRAGHCISCASPFTIPLSYSILRNIKRPAQWPSAHGLAISIIRSTSLA